MLANQPDDGPIIRGHHLATPVPRRRAKPYISKNRFDPRSSEDVSPAVVEFGCAMIAYLSRWRCRAWTCGQVLDVLVELGYVNSDRNFEACVHAFTLAVEKLKRGRIVRRNSKRIRVPNRFPTWSEVLAVAIKCGWSRAAI